MKKTGIITIYILAGVLMSFHAYADVISDAPVEIGTAPVIGSAATEAPSAGTDEMIVSGTASSAGSVIEIDLSELNNLPAAAISAPVQETVSEEQPAVTDSAILETTAPAMEAAAPADNASEVISEASPASGIGNEDTSDTSVSADESYSAPVQYVTVGGSVTGSLTGPSMISSGSSEESSQSSPVSMTTGNGEIGSRYAADSRSRVDLGYTLVSPTIDYNGFKVAEGSAQLGDGSWEAVTKNQYIRNRYYKLLSEQTDSNGNSWYVVKAGGRQVGNYRTSDGSILSEIWLKKSDCTVQNYLDLNTSNPTRQQIVKNALELLGKRYQFAANGPDAFDCSGFVNYVMGTVGISVPRTSSELCYAGTQVSFEELRPGDIIGRPGHVGIYIGDGWFVHASESNTGVITESVEVYNRSNRFTNYVNVVGD